MISRQELFDITKTYLMQDFLYIKDGRKLYQVFFSDLQYIEAARRYVKFVTIDRTYLKEGSLYEIEAVLPTDQFCRIHRCYIISFRYARQLEAKKVHVADRELPIGKTFKGVLLSKMATISDVKIV